MRDLRRSAWGLKITDEFLSATEGILACRPKPGELAKLQLGGRRWNSARGIKVLEYAAALFIKIPAEVSLSPRLEGMHPNDCTAEYACEQRRH